MKVREPMTAGKKAFRFFGMIFLATVAAWTVAHALTFEKKTVGTPTISYKSGQATITGDAQERTVLDYIKDYVDIPDGAVDWKVFGQTKEIRVEYKTKEGYDGEYFKPEFPAAVKAMDGKEITIKGFMFPLGPNEEQTEFLFGPFPINCPFHYHVGPSLVIEAHADKHPIKFVWDPIVLKGKLTLVPLDKENSTFYRFTDITIVKK